MPGRIEIDVAMLEFDEGGNTIWVHGPNGATVLRIKCTGKLSTKVCATNISAHADLMVNGDIEVCMPPKTVKTAKLVAACERCGSEFEWADSEAPPKGPVFCSTCEGPLKGVLNFRRAVK